jgi:hypothetical protein
MNCYECAQKNSERAAVGLCHNCSAVFVVNMFSNDLGT